MLWGIQNQLRIFLRALLGQQVFQHDVTATTTAATTAAGTTITTAATTATA
jgi:hypothetical protein